MSHLKLGSLFDGSGGFPLSAALCGITPVWASEVEPYPIAVTRSRYPNRKHLGDVSKVNGAEIEPVDIIALGSPCQDLSVAGKRAGIKHTDNGDEETTRSGLFMEAVRIIKEMRHGTKGQSPTFVVWENVFGAFSSNEGRDFWTVLDELIKIAEPQAVMPDVPQGGWAYADCYRGDGWSLAYRVFDAQYWGVPQRRRRVYLVLDFGGQRAREILFEREGLRGDFEEGGTPWEGTPSRAKGSLGAANQEGAYGFPLGFRSENIRVHKDTATTLCNGTRPGFCNGVVLCYDSRGNGDGKTANTITGDHENRITDYSSVVVIPAEPTGDTSPCDPVICLQGNGIDRADTAGCNGRGWKEDTCYTLNTVDRPAVVYALDRASFNQGANARYDFEITSSGVNSTIVSKGPSAVCYGIGNGQANQSITEDVVGALNCMHDQQGVVVPYGPYYIVRRLTPTECARLQGFPDFWGHPDKKAELTDEDYRFWLDVRRTHDCLNGRQAKAYTKNQILTWYNKLHTDSSEYRMWGNGIALPCALFIMRSISNRLEDKHDRP